MNKPAEQEIADRGPGSRRVDYMAQILRDMATLRGEVDAPPREFYEQRITEYWDSVYALDRGEKESAS